MVPGIYTAASGMIAQMEKTDVVSNNLANSSTTGFKRDTTVIQSFPSYLWGHLHWMGGIQAPVDFSKTPIGIKGQGTLAITSVTDHTGGVLHRTAGDTDVALKGSGFFSVQAPQGERYTRDGAFSIDGAGRLVTKDGCAVLGDIGPILVQGGKLRIDSAGWVHVDGARVDRMKIVTFAKPTDFQKAGDNLYRSSAEPVDARAATEVLQGYVEASNVNTIREMVDLITVMRAYEAAQRMVITQDATLQKAVNEIARPV